MFYSTFLLLILDLFGDLIQTINENGYRMKQLTVLCYREKVERIVVILIMLETKPRLVESPNF